MADTIPPITSSVTAAVANNAASSATSTTCVDRNTLAGNFQTFLTLLTTQLKNQNPLDPLDTNQFTQQLVQFAQVEQQLKQNEQALDSHFNREERTGDDRARLCGPDGGGRRPDRSAQERQGELELPGSKTDERHRHDQERDRPDGLFQQLHHECRSAEFHLGRPRQQRRAMAGRQLHDLDQRQGCERAGCSAVDRGGGSG